MDPLIVTRRVTVPVSAMSWHAVRSAGPGGQHVNKTASKVELRVALDQIEGLSDPQRARLRQRAGPRLDADGLAVFTSQRTRSQAQNLEDAREKLRELVAASLVAPKRRIPTKPSRAAKRRRLEGKRRQSEKKRERRYRPG